MTEDNRPQEVQGNVIDFQTRQALLPSQVRAAIIGQYAESKELGHEPVVFANRLEERLLSNLAMAGAKAIKSAFTEQFGENDE